MKRRAQRFLGFRNGKELHTYLKKIGLVRTVKHVVHRPPRWAWGGIPYKIRRGVNKPPESGWVKTGDLQTAGRREFFERFPVGTVIEGIHMNNESSFHYFVKSHEGWLQSFYNGEFVTVEQPVQEELKELNPTVLLDIDRLVRQAKLIDESYSMTSPVLVNEVGPKRYQMIDRYREYQKVIFQKIPPLQKTNGGLMNYLTWVRVVSNILDSGIFALNYPQGVEK